MCSSDLFPSHDTVYRAINDLDLSFVNNTAGVRSISKYELQSKLLEIGVSKYGHVPKCVVSSGSKG